MRAPKTRNVLKADAVYVAESNSTVTDSARLLSFGGVCVVGMYEKTQPRNLGGPAHSIQGRYNRNRLQGYTNDEQEVRWLHITEEAE